MTEMLNLREIVTALSLYFPAEWVKAALVLALFSNCVVIGMFSYLNRYTKKAYFSLWTVAWMFQAVWLAASIGLEESPSAPYLIMARRACIGISALFMFWGSFQLTNQQRSQRELGMGVVMAVLWSWVAAFKVREHLWITLPVFLLLAFASIYTGRLYMRYRNRYRGAELLSAGFILWGFHLLGFPFEKVMPPAFMVGGYFVSAILSLFIAMGMIVQVLEQVRERNETLLEGFKKGVAQRRLLEHEITVSEEKYRVLFDSASDAIFLVDLETLEIIEANQSAQRLLGRESTDLVGRVFLEFSPQLQAQSGALLTGSVLERKNTLQEAFSSYRELHVVRMNGTHVVCEGDASLVKCQKRPVLQINIREVTERKKMEQQLRQSEKLSALGQLVAGVAHELNNPLAVVMGYAQILAKGKDLAEKSRNEMIRIVHESDRAAKIVRNLLTFARLREPALEAVDINQLVNGVLESHETQLSTGKIQIEKHLERNLPLTKADANQIDQVLTNLLANAIQAVTSREAPRKITVYTEENGLFIRIAMADSGPGIAPETINKIFDPFFTTKAPGKGTGLGLSICYSIVQEHRGRIWVQSELGKGATFFVELPIVACLPGEKEQTPIVEEKAVTVPSSQRRLLVVDDEPGIVEVLKEILGSNGYDVDTATNGVEAMNRIEKGRYDLVISDLSMPEMGGEKLYETLRKQHPQLARRVIFVTGDTVSPKARQFLEGVGNQWLSKPFNIAEIERLVGSFLSRQTTPATAEVAVLR